MANITSALQKMNDQEISADAVLSQALMLKVGANINGLIDRGARRVVFLVSGTWVCPADVTQVTLFGAGGGGGGGLGSLSTSSNQGRSYAGQGGGGAVPAYVTVTVTPSTSYPVTVGAGGAGATTAGGGFPDFGTQGGNTTLGTIATFYGANGGGRGANYPFDNGLFSANGGSFSYGTFAQGGTTEQNGQPTNTALGGVRGNASGATGAAGGGGGAGIGAGGAGGYGARSAPAGPGLNGGTSAGGGGGGVSYNDTGNIPYTQYINGGNGGPGMLVINY